MPCLTQPLTSMFGSDLWVLSSRQLVVVLHLSANHGTMRITSARHQPNLAQKRLLCASTVTLQVCKDCPRVSSAMHHPHDCH
jgi:hypothetical protein